MSDVKEEIFDIYDIWDESLWTQTWFILILAIILTIIVSIVLYFIYTIYFNKPAKIDSLAIIQKRLAVLGNISIKNEQDGKRIYFELTELLKQYIAYQYHISVQGLTDKEIVDWACLVMPEDQVNKVKQLLLGVTSIKFEHQIVTLERLKKDVQLMQEFIDKSIQESTDCKDI